MYLLDGVLSMYLLDGVCVAYLCICKMGSV